MTSTSRCGAILAITKLMVSKKEAVLEIPPSNPFHSNRCCTAHKEPLFLCSANFSRAKCIIMLAWLERRDNICISVITRLLVGHCLQKMFLARPMQRTGTRVFKIFITLSHVLMATDKCIHVELCQGVCVKFPWLYVFISTCSCLVSMLTRLHTAQQAQ